MNYLRSNLRRVSGLSMAAVLAFAIGCGGDDDSSSNEETVTPRGDAGGSSGSKDASTGTGGGKDASTGTGGGKDASTGTGGGNDAGTGTGGGNDAGTGTGTGNAAAIARGKAIVDEEGCTSCHGKAYSGAGFYPNITPDEDTGIGSWTDQEIDDAIVSGLDQEGNELCASMNRYPFDTDQIADVIAFLRSVPAVKKEITGVCK